MKNNNTSYQRPFLKWAGGKYRLLPRILKALPNGNKLIEPFVGSGVVFLNTNYDRYLLTDINPDLINLFNDLKQGKARFIDYCAQYFVEGNNLEKRFYELRNHFNQLEAGWERSALFLYFNRHGYNGLCRYNQSGGFNVPFGRYKKPYFPAREMEFFYQKARKAEFRCQPFLKTMAHSRKGSVIFCLYRIKMAAIITKGYKKQGVIVFKVVASLSKAVNFVMNWVVSSRKSTIKLILN
ncbi:MAG: Dam family site-specific DNA-(adenine-N6)-methyltransferase [Gammaproteobacteria bacterium]|nr:Dam family site-specific DNA-(adenine-N6)-methyltransferase [Gammaproteobacteria bacterium]